MFWKELIIYFLLVQYGPHRKCIQPFLVAKGPSLYSRFLFKMVAYTDPKNLVLHNTDCIEKDETELLSYSAFIRRHDNVFAALAYQQGLATGSNL
jgi:hypothetical protein